MTDGNNHIIDSDSEDHTLPLSQEETISGADFDETLILDVDSNDATLVSDHELDRLFEENQFDSEADVTATGLTPIAPAEGASGTEQYIFALELVKQRKWSEAIPPLRQSLSMDPSGTAYHAGKACALIGYAHLRLGDVQDAITHYRRALDIDPNLTGVRTGLATALVKAGNVDEALGALQAALQVDSARAVLHFNCGNLLMRAGRVDEAEASYRSALQLDGDHLGSMINLGVALAQRKAYDESVGILCTACQNSRDAKESWRARFNLGIVYGRLKRWDDAVDVLQDIVDDTPNTNRARLLLARILRCANRHLEAIERLGEPMDWGRWHSRCQELLGLIHNDLDNPVQALVFWQEAARLDPSLGRIHAHIARRQLQSKDFGAAEESVTKAIELQNDRPETWLIAGEVALAQHQLDGAEQAFLKAIELKPNYSDAMYWLGRTHLENGELIGAVRQWERLDYIESPLASRLKRRIDQLQS
ncbi:MAG: tetratricopeptide repeat protein [Phycisphaerales bacterium]|nr:tetratricopeptide repeat protein [Phycisphaerales bacterium]